MSTAIEKIKERIGITQEGDEAVVLYTALDALNKQAATIKQLKEANKQGANANAFLKAIIDSKDSQVIALEARCKESNKRADKFESALRKINGISWGYDGDCGAQKFIDDVL